MKKLTFIMSGYTLSSKTRSHKRGGGVGLYISDRLNYKTRDDLIAVTEECPFEWLFIEAEVDNNAIVIWHSLQTSGHQR